jgi:hypothetical protein
LEKHFGVEMQALMVQYYLITQAAQKAGVMPGKAEIDDIVRDAEESNPQLAESFQKNDLKKADFRLQKEMEVALANVRAKDVKVTEDEVKAYYEKTIANWDEPIRLSTRVLVCADAASVAKARVALEQASARAIETKDEKGVPQRTITDLNVIQDNLKPRVALSYNDGKYTFYKPYSHPAADVTANKLAAMKLGEVVEAPGQNGQRLLIVLEKRVEGKRLPLTDLETRRKVERAYRLTRALPPQEVLRNLWDSARITTDPPTLKSQIEAILLPERARLEQQSQAP